MHFKHLSVAIVVALFCLAGQSAATIPLTGVDSGSASGSALFISSGTKIGPATGLSTTLTIPGSPQTGDLLLVDSEPEDNTGLHTYSCVLNGTTTSMTSLGNHTTVQGGFNSQVFYHTLAAGDVSNGTVTCTASGGTNVWSTGGLAFGVWRGPTTAAFRSQTNSTLNASTLAVLGVVPNALTRGMLQFVVDGDTSSPFAPPAGWTQRLAPTTQNAQTIGIAENLTYLNQTYTWTGFATTLGQWGTLVELLP